MTTAFDADQVAKIALEVVAEHDPKQVPLPEFLGACYDAGLAWVHFPEGLGGLGTSRGLQAVADNILQGAGGPVPLGLNPMGYGMAAPTVREHAQTDEIKKFFLLDTQLSAEDEELTPTMKLKRKLVEKKYAAQIDAMYR